LLDVVSKSGNFAEFAKIFCSMHQSFQNQFHSLFHRNYKNTHVATFTKTGV